MIMKVKSTVTEFRISEEIRNNDSESNGKGKQREDWKIRT